MSTNDTSDIGELHDTQPGSPENADHEKVAAINAMLRRNRASGAPVDGEEALRELRADFARRGDAG